MIHIFDIEKEAILANSKESINDGLLNLGPVRISMENTKSVSFVNYKFDQYSLRDIKNFDVDHTDQFRLNDTFDTEVITNWSLDGGSFQQDLPASVLPNNRLLALGNSNFQDEIDTQGPELFQYKTISDIIGGTTTQIESSSHGLIEGDILYIDNVVGMTEINNSFGAVITVVDSNNVIVNIDSSGYSAYVSGGELKVSVYPISNIGNGTVTQITTQKENDFAVNDYVVFYGVSGCKQINGTRGKVLNIISSTQFTVDINSSEFSSYNIQLVSMTDSSTPPNTYNVYYGGYVSKTPSEKYLAWADRLSSKFVYDNEDNKVITHNEDYSSPTIRSFWNLVGKEEKKFAMKFYEFFSNLDHSGDTQHRFDFQEFDYNLTTPEEFDNLKNRTDVYPELYSWLQNKTGIGYDSIHYNVQEVKYSDDNVYVESTGIPEYLQSVDPWKTEATNRFWSFQIPRTVTVKGNKTTSPLGPVGVLINGVPLYNFKNGESFRSKGIWNNNTVISLKELYDDNDGVLTPSGTYCHVYAPLSLYGETGDTVHSPLLGYALDGCPIYGPYGYEDYDPLDSTPTIVRIQSGYTLRNIKERGTLPDGTELEISEYGPPIPPYDYEVKISTTENLSFVYVNNQGNNATLTNSIVGYTVVDNVQLEIDDQILIKNQNNSIQNGIYQVTSAGPSSYTTLRRIRIHDEVAIKAVQRGQYNEAAYGYNESNGNKVLVSSGRINGNTSWILEGGNRIGITPISATQFDAYPLGYFAEDFEFTGDGVNTLDEYNGRFGRTPEYPNGVYAYFTTLNPDETPAYPYAIAEEYYAYVSDLSIKNAGKSKAYDSVKYYINKVEGLKVQILQNDTMYELVSLSPETWEKRLSKSSSFGQKNKNFFYNKSIGLDSFASPELLESLGFDPALDESLEFPGNIETIPSNPYENTTIDALRSGTRENPTFNSEYGTWSNSDTAYRDFVASSSYDRDISNTSVYVSRRLDSSETANPLTVKMYSTIVIDVPATSVFYTYFNQDNWGGSMILDWEVFTVPYGFGGQPYGESPYGGE